MVLDGFHVSIVVTFVFLIILERLCCEIRSQWRRRVILRRYAHTEKVRFALGEGETIVGGEGGAEYAVFLYRQPQQGRERV